MPSSSLTWMALGSMLALLCPPLITCASLELQFDNFTDYHLNISFPTFDRFKPPASSIKKVYMHTVKNEHFIYVGSKNHLYYLDYNPSNLDNLWTLKGAISLGSLRELDCIDGQPVNKTSSRDNYITEILPFESGQYLYACGTARHGTCFIVASNLARTATFGSPCDSMNLMVASDLKHKSIVLPVQRGDNLIYYVGYDHDDNLEPSLNPPLLSIRAAVTSTTRIGFELASISAELPSSKIGQIVLANHTLHGYRFQFVYAFEHEDSIYFVTVQNRPNAVNVQTQATWLVRLCRSDLLLNSWTQMELECWHEGKKYHVANVAHLESKLTRSGSSYQKMEKSEQSKTYLHVAFYAEDDKSSSVCRYDMSTVSRELDQASEQCHYAQQSLAGLMKAMQPSRDSSTSCTRIEKRSDNFLCFPHSNNRFIESHVPHKQEAFLNLANDKITSMFSVMMFSPTMSAHAHRHKRQLILATRHARIINLAVPNDLEAQKAELLYASNLSPDVYGKEIAPEPVLHASSASLVMASELAIFSVPFQGCHIFSSCSACNSNDCVWSSSKCQPEKDLSVTRACEPEIYGFEPKRGPIQGGTEITFWGTNFGEPDSQTDRDHNRLEIEFDHVACEVHYRTNQMVKCRLPERDLAGNNGEIYFEAVARTSIEVPFRINGKKKLEDKFTFVTPLVKGVYPSFGPYIGGTEVLVYGSNLGHGSNHKIRLDQVWCDVITKCIDYLVCKTAQQSRQPQEEKRAEIKVEIDGFTEVINNPHGTAYPIQFGTSTDNARCTNRFAPPNEDVSSPYESQVIFNASFVFMPNPIIDVDELRVLESGHPIKLKGDNFSSVHKPAVFDVLYDDDKVMQANPCEQIVSNTLIVCQLPALVNWQGKRVSVLFHLDGYNKTIKLTVYTRLIFRTDRNYEIGEDLLLKISDITNMHADIPVQVNLNDTIPCLTNISVSGIVCTLNASESQLSELADLQLPINVIVGNSSFRAGQAHLVKKLDARLTIAVGVILFLGFLGIVFFGSFEFYKFHANKQMAKEYRLITKKFYEELHKHFLQSFGDDKFYQQLYASNRLIPPEKFRETSYIDSGNFSTVNKAFYDNKLVAIKIVKFTGSEDQQEQMKDFLKEAEFMKDFNHENVISLLGVTIYPDMPAIVTPFMINGKLLSYLRREESNITYMTFFNFALQIAKGMQYLAERKLVHRDLAARNVLINESMVLKVADFGLTRRFKQNEVYYRQTGNGPAPICWMSLESIERGLYDTKSDVWSYGVVLWEILACGHTPWQEIQNWDEVALLLKKGYRLANPMPEEIPDYLYQLAYQCWNADPNARPTFKELIHQIQQILTDCPCDENREYYSNRISRGPELSQPQQSINFDGHRGLESATSSHQFLESIEMDDLSRDTLISFEDHHHRRGLSQRVLA